MNDGLRMMGMAGTSIKVSLKKAQFKASKTKKTKNFYVVKAPRYDSELQWLRRRSFVSHPRLHIQTIRLLWVHAHALDRN